MATAVQPLTLQEFRTRYHDQKPYFEYWFGEAIQKAVPTWLHAVLQGIMIQILVRAGYKSGSELELRIDAEWQPVADVVGTLRSIDQYPTDPVEIVVEILSPDDRLSYVLKKCQNYARIGIPQIFVLDPETKSGWQWNSGSLETVSQLKFANGSVVPLSDVWRQLDEHR